MAATTDYYKVLGLTKTASKDEIRKAYKKLARKYHPDANADDPDALTKFKEVQKAWEVLGDEEKRKNYDQYGDPEGPRFRGGAGAGSAGAGGPGGGAWGWSSADGGEVPFDLEELFSGFRSGGGGGGRRGSQRRDWPVRGQDIRAEVEVPFSLAAEGGRYDLHLKRDSGATETLTVNIPEGVDTGSVIRLSGQGTPGMNGGKPGDLLVTIRVARHPLFRREGSRILLDVPISITECALGTKVEIPTLRDGNVTLTIPPGTSSGAKLRLREKGIRDRRSGKRGDMIAVVKIVAPKRLDDRAKELLTNLQQHLSEDPRSGLWK